MPPPPNTWEDDEETIVSERSRSRRGETDDAASTSPSGALRPGISEDDRATEAASASAGERPPGVDEDALSTVAERSEDDASTIVEDSTGIVKPSDQPAAWLVVTASPRAAERHRLIQLAAARTVIGRAPGHTRVLVDDPAVSRQHAAIRFEQRSGIGDGEFTLYDLASTHGTFLNGERVAAPRVLHDGDRIRLGTTEFAFKRL